MFSIVTTSVLLSLLHGCSAVPTGQQCTPVAGPSCACQPPEGGQIDLTPLSNPGTPRYAGLQI